MLRVLDSSSRKLSVAAFRRLPLRATVAVFFEASFGSCGWKTISCVQEVSRTFSRSDLGFKSIRLLNSSTCSIILSSSRISHRISCDITGRWSLSLRFKFHIGSQEFSLWSTIRRLAIYWSLHCMQSWLMSRFFMDENLSPWLALEIGQPSDVGLSLFMHGRLLGCHWF